MKTKLEIPVTMCDNPDCSLSNGRIVSSKQHVHLAHPWKVMVFIEDTAQEVEVVKPGDYHRPCLRVLAMEAIGALKGS